MHYDYQWCVVGILPSGDCTVKKSSRLRSVGGKFGGIKWKNITVQEIVLFYRVMFHMSIDPRHLGGYEGYFKPTSYVGVGRGYNVNLVVYGGWT